MRLSIKLTLSFLIIALVVLIFGYFASIKSKKMIQDIIGENSALLAEETLDKINRTISRSVEGLSIYFEDLILKNIIIASNDKFDKMQGRERYIDARNEEWISAEEGEVTPFMQEVLDRRLSRNLQSVVRAYEKKYGYPLFGEIFVTNKYGANIAQSGRTTDFRQNDEDWWQGAKENRIHIGDIEYDESAKIYSMDLCIRVDDNRGNFIGVIKAVYNIQGIIDILAGLGSTSKFILLNRNGKVIYSSYDHEFFEDISKTRPELRLTSLGDSKYKDYFIVKGIMPDKKDELYARAHSKGHIELKNLGWTLFVIRETANIFAPITEFRKILIAISFPTAIFAILLGIFISYTISGRIMKLRRAALRIGKGYLDQKIEMRGRDEISELAASFSQMARDLKISTFSQAYVHSIIENMADILLVITPDGKIQTVNRAACGFLGYKEEELVGQDVSILFPEDEQKEGIVPLKGSMFDKLIRDGALKGYEIDYKKRDGKLVPVLFSGSVMKDQAGNVTNIVCVAKDIAERKKAERELRDQQYVLKKINEELRSTQMQLIHAAKMEAVGTMASGVAHEVKNPLGIILQGINYIEKKHPKEGDMADVSRRIKENIKRADLIIRGLVDFSRSEELNIKSEDINSVLESALSLTKHKFKLGSIEVIREYREALPKVPVDDAKIEQVFINVFLNAIQAMPDGGKLYIRSYSTRLTKARENIGRRSEDRFKLNEEAVVVEVEDTGIGIPEKNISRIFDPFFTTKGPREGTGLGLAVSRNIMDLHKGLIEIESEPGKGSKVMVILKIARGEQNA
jgi:PAS domain S-box-containing protein